MHPWQKGWRLAVAAVLSGAAMALGQAPWHLPYLMLVTVPLLLWLSSARGPRGGFWVGWLAGAGYFSVALFWIVEPFLVDVAQHGWMAPFALIFMAGGLALFWGAGFAIGRIGRRGGISGVVLLAAAWTLAEYGRTTLLTGFPWALVAYAWEDTPLRQAAAFIGPHGLGFLTLLSFGVAFGLRHRPLGGGIAVLVLAGSWILLASRVPEEVAMQPVSLRLVQPNVDQAEKWQSQNAQRFYDRLLDLTDGHDGADAVIWPEAAVPYVLNHREDLNAAIAATAGPDTVVLLGALTISPENENIHNSLVGLGPDGAILAQYDKHHLVPFGEYLPLPGLVEKLGLAPLAAHAGRMSAGQGPSQMKLDGLPPFQPLICYEAIFPDEVLRGADRPDWLLQVTNDAWFGAYSGPYQHLAQARFRAVEQGLPVVRAANTGISAVIDPYGRIGAFLELGEMGVIDSLLPQPLQPTLYARLGDRWIVLTILAIFLICLVISRPYSIGAQR